MAAKKQAPKAQDLDLELEAMTKASPQTLQTLNHSVQELAQMGFNHKHALSKGQESDIQPAIEAHKEYLKAINAGAQAEAKDIDFVKSHLKHLLSL